MCNILWLFEQKILQSGDHNLEQFLDQILERFLAECTGCDDKTDILKEVGIYRMNQTTGDVRFVIIPR